MSECDFCQEDQCIFDGFCNFQDEEKQCIATDDDLEELCCDCWMPEDECQCGS